MSSFMDNVKVVFLDVDDTLLDFQKNARLSIYNAAAELNVLLPDETEEVFHRINDSLWMRIQNGTITLEELHKVRWRLILEELGVSCDPDAFENEFVRQLHESAELVDGAAELVRGLSRKYTLCIATNATLEEQEKRLRKSGLRPYISKIFASADVGYAKPQKEFFDACFREFPGLLPQETLMIGDSISSDMEGAHAYGMKTYWLNRKNVREIPECVDKMVTSWR